MNKRLRSILISIPIIVATVFLIQIETQSNKAEYLRPLDKFSMAIDLLGDPYARMVEEEKVIYLFEGSFFAAGPIEIRTNNENRITYLRIYEDAEPEWNLEKQPNDNQAVLATPLRSVARP